HDFKRFARVPRGAIEAAPRNRVRNGACVETSFGRARLRNPRREIRMHQPNGKTRGRGNSSDQITRPLAAALCLAMGVLWGCETPAKVQEPEPQAEPESVGQ